MRNIVRITSFQVLQKSGMRLTVTFAINNLNSTSSRVENKQKVFEMGLASFKLDIQKIKYKSHTELQYI
jgi:hypothetical protein